MKKATQKINTWKRAKRERREREDKRNGRTHETS